MTIGEAAQMLALNTSALRYYEDRGFELLSVECVLVCVSVFCLVL
ncbi:MAG: MerR family regulatory protein [Mycobacterium sp.]|nr:hypothetical protein [Mycobacterium sp.]MDT5055726.1 MerR family regulatory protein [Mycobacterium sp.]